MRVAVAGGTGVVGRHVVDAATGAGHEVVVLARSRGVDVVTGAGLDEALAGVDAVVDVTNLTTTGRRRSVAFFTAITRALLAAGRRAGVSHHVALSIVGVDRVGFGYYAGKRAQEDLVLAGPVPGSVLRATQFHEFPDQVLARVPGPVAVVPRMRVAPVAAAEVGAALVALAAGPARGTAPELAGPEEHDLVDLARRADLRPLAGRPRPGPAGVSRTQESCPPLHPARPRLTRVAYVVLGSHTEPMTRSPSATGCAPRGQRGAPA